LQLPDGLVTFWESRVGAVKEGDVVTGLAVVASDVTERREAAADRDLLFRLSIDLCSVASFDGYFRRVNPAFERTLGWSERELLSRPFIEFVHEDDRASTLDATERLRAGENITDFVNRYRCADGQFRTLSWRSKSVPETRLIYCTARDVTERLALEEQLRQAQRMDAVGQLAGGIAHDFNNLLLVMMGNLDLALLSRGDTQNIDAPLRDVQQACQRARDLTRQLLAFSRRQPLQIRDTSINELVAGALTWMQRVLPEHIVIEFTRGPGLPVVNADAGQMEQVVMNLCLNARDAMPDGGLLKISSQRVELGAEDCQTRYAGCEPGAYVRLDIKDTGTGMDPQTLARAFEPFFTTKAPGRGTGLGLPVVLAAVREHKGAVVLESVPGAGTTCSLFLPLASSSIRALATGAPESRRSAALRVLLVDDEPDVCLTAAQLIRQLGHNVLALCSGEKALSHLKVHANGYDLLVLDVMMPNPRGPELYRALLAEGIDLPTLFMSGSADQPLLGALARRPGVAFLQKPFRQAELALAIAQCTEAWQTGIRAAANDELRAG
jgi:PAS domain S-box-containing protein